MVFCLQFIDSSGATLLEALNLFSNLSSLSCEYFRYTSIYLYPRFSALCLLPFLGCSFSLIWKPLLCLYCCLLLHQGLTHLSVTEMSLKNLSFSRIIFEENWLWTITDFSQGARTFSWISVHLFLPLSVTFFVVISPKTQISISKLPSLIIFRYKSSILKLTSHY